MEIIERIQTSILSNHIFMRYKVVAFLQMFAYKKTVIASRILANDFQF